MNRFPGVLALGVALVLVAGLTRAADPPTPVPPAAAITAAEKSIRDIYKADYAKKKTVEQIELARKLLKDGEATANDPASRYFLFQEARTLATKAGDMALALNATHATSRYFAVNRVDLTVTTLEALAKLSTPPLKTIVECALDNVEAQIQADDYAGAARFLKVATAAASRLNISALNASVTAKTKDLEVLRKGFEDVANERKILAKEPNDVIAAHRVGRFLCLTKGDWEAGLPLLAKGEDQKLKAAALKDLARPKEAPAKAELADVWYDLAEGLDPRERAQVRIRAYTWYVQAIPSLAGVPRARVEKRVEEMTKGPSGFGRGGQFGWVVLLRSDDPTIWNTDTETVDQYAVPLTRAPIATRYLKLTDVKKAEFVIIEMSQTRLAERIEQDAYGWNGTKENYANAIHLGIYDKAWSTNVIGSISIAYTANVGDYRGWGFGHRAYIGDRQGYTWSGNPIDKTVFEIAVKITGLTPEESKRLLKKK